MKSVLLALITLPAFLTGQDNELPIIRDPYISNTGWLDFSWSSFNHHSDLGVAVGATYFVTRYIGIGFEAYSPSNNVDISGVMVIRYPVKEHIIATYGVFTFGNSTSFGSGVRIALDHDFDIFVEGKYHLNKSEEAMELRLGAGFRFW